MYAKVLKNNYHAADGSFTSKAKATTTSKPKNLYGSKAGGTDAKISEGGHYTPAKTKEGTDIAYVVNHASPDHVAGKAAYTESVIQNKFHNSGAVYEYKDKKGKQVAQVANHSAGNGKRVIRPQDGSGTQITSHVNDVRAAIHHYFSKKATKKIEGLN